jgi:ribokinase
MTVVVFGSINIDLVARTPRLPVAGETLVGYSFETIPGGKGANQAVAVARLGIPTQMVGRVGGDAFGQTLRQGLLASGVGCDRVLIDDTTHSGVAVINVDDRSENTIVIVAGANGQVGDADVGSAGGQGVDAATGNSFARCRSCCPSGKSRRGNGGTRSGSRPIGFTR